MRHRSPSSQRRTRPARAALAVIAALLVAAPLLAGCSGVERSTDSGGGFPEVGEEAPGVDDGSGGGDGESDGDGREVIVTGSLYLTVDDPLEAADEAARIVERAGGRVDGRREYSPTDAGTDGAVAYDEQGQYLGSFPGGGAVLELRIPSERLTAVLDDLAALGEQEELVLSSDDVTVEVRDLEARIAALRASIERLLALQATAADLDDLLALETAISDRQAELESLEAQQRYYDDQVSLSTITLTLGSQEVAPVDEPDSFLTGLATGWEALLAFLGGALVVLGVLLPWLLVLGLLALVALLAVRRARRRRAGAAAATPAVGAPESVSDPR